MALERGWRAGRSARPARRQCPDTVARVRTGGMALSGDGEQGGGRTRLPGFPDGVDAIQCRARIVSGIGHRR
ncbi:hypothetical protein NB643_04900 [Oxalobacter aliiformigenes]|uniref:Uncharacterized protein n=1 Tax=Oxalobacter aliiformigenes TaxID=2946593 RepID=A0ABY7JP42_9BURK|nr:hypothetical protein [Oxalobacter aliiformigenes]WAV92400.1 hypothetical protein NB641_06210 [Oxalobacter aliiformigenes]WAV96090.1 hypothetical protein NB643_04900 [Oxalobacter aliiformigenes]WAV97994.1 hypothetical protein NB645_04515 [Oxalobacter aliiformigenes]